MTRRDEGGDGGPDWRGRDMRVGASTVLCGAGLLRAWRPTERQSWSCGSIGVAKSTALHWLTLGMMRGGATMLAEERCKSPDVSYGNTRSGAPSCDKRKSRRRRLLMRVGAFFGQVEIVEMPRQNEVT